MNLSRKHFVYTLLLVIGALALFLVSTPASARPHHHGIGKAYKSELRAKSRLAKRTRVKHHRAARNHTANYRRPTRHGSYSRHARSRHVVRWRDSARSRHVVRSQRLARAAQHPHLRAAGSAMLTAAKVAGASRSQDNSRLVSEARRWIGGNPTGRRSLWCARFMNFVLHRLGFRGTGSDMARSFASYGRRVPGPRIGAIAVMSRGKRGGHVGVVSGFDKSGNPIVVSGNHGNRVAEARYSRGRIYAYVMPSS